MRWEDAVALVGKEAVFSSALLLAGDVSPQQVRLQLSRWVKSDRLLQLRRGLYALAPVWRKTEAHPFLVANALRRGSYVSLEAALAYHGVIPEHVPVVTSVGPVRPETVRNPLGTFQFKRVAKNLLFGYSRIEVAPRQFAFVASAEKALLDLVYLTPGADSPEYLRELRLQHSDAVCIERLRDLAERSGKPKLIRAARIAGLIFKADEGTAP